MRNCHNIEIFLTFSLKTQIYIEITVLHASSVLILLLCTAIYIQLHNNSAVASNYLCS